MKIFNLFLKQKKKSSEQQLKDSSVNENKIEFNTQVNNCVNTTLKLYFTIVDLYGNMMELSYDILQVKIKQNTLKCICKINKDIENFSQIKNDFLNDIVVFPLSELNKYKFLYETSDNTLSVNTPVDKSYYNKTAGIVYVSMNSDANLKLMRKKLCKIVQQNTSYLLQKLI